MGSPFKLNCFSRLQWILIKIQIFINLYIIYKFMSEKVALKRELGLLEVTKRGV